MAQIQECHPRAIKVGDRINHGGAICLILAVEQVNDAYWDTWKFIIQSEATGGDYIVYYHDDNLLFDVVKRYE